MFTKFKLRKIVFNFRSGLSGQECINELKYLVGDKATSYSTINNWLNEFNYGRRSLKGEVREGPPKTAVVPENINAVRELTMQDRHMKMKASFGISSNSIYSILQTTGRKKDLFSLDSAKFDKRSKKVSCRLV